MKKQGVFSAIFVLLFVCYGQVFGGFVDQTSQYFGASSISGGHVAWGDFNNDGWVDITSSDVWRNNNGNSFTSIADNKGWCWGDYDNDGFLDLFDGSRLARNVNGTSFVTVQLPPLSSAVIRGYIWGDLDNDGYLDIYAGGYEVWATQTTYPDRIFHNNGGISFSLDWEETVYRARGVTSCDFDEDNDIDIYVSNYRLQPNRLWLNDGTGSFTDVAGAYNAQAGAGHSIGAAFGDFDNDGHMDIFAGNFAHGGQPESRFLQNQGPPNYHFTDKGTCGVFYQESYASPAVGDIDNDGYLDLFFTTVYSGDNPALFRNDGSWGFDDVTNGWGLSGIGATYEAAFADFDNDGDLDLISGNRLWVNQGNSNHWLKIKLVGNGVSVNTTAIGTQVRINITGLGTLTRQVEGGTGEGNQNDPTLHFGLGSHTGPVELEIRWLDGTVDYVTTAIDRYIQITQRDALNYDLIVDGAIDYNDLKVITDSWTLNSLTDYNSMVAPDISHWKFDGDATDSFGSNDGTVIGDPVWSAGVINSAVQFDGGDYIDCGNDISLDLTNNFTIALWLKPEHLDRAIQFCKGDLKAFSSGGAYNYITDGSGNIRFYIRNSTNTGSVNVSTPIMAGQWVHLAATFSDANLFFYKNGLAVDSDNTLSTPTINTNAGPLAIGADGDGGESYSGVIDDVRIYNYVVSQPDILALTNVPDDLNCDLNGDRKIDFEEFALLAGEWKLKAVEIEVIVDLAPPPPSRE